MTQEEKQLLLKDLCARLPYYGVRIAYKENEHDIHHWTLCTLHTPHIGKDGTIIDTGSDGWIEYVEYPGAGMSTGSRPLHLEKMLPYLRSMSSMTDEEKMQLKEEQLKDTRLFAEALTKAAAGDTSMRGKVIPHFAADWCNKNHFDYRGLIPMGLALEAPKDM